jgi:hypothetical protein
MDIHVAHLFLNNNYMINFLNVSVKDETPVFDPSHQIHKQFLSNDMFTNIFPEMDFITIAKFICQPSKPTANLIL